MNRHSVLPRGGSAIATVLLLPILSIAPGARPATAALDASLSPLSPYVGRVFSAEMAVPDAPKPAIDVQRWEEILGGKAVRITHSINGGDYGGESLVAWDSERQAIVYWYVTNAGFYTQGTITAAGDSLVTREQVVGEAGGVTEVEAVWHLTADGYAVTSRYLGGGQWSPGRTASYRETPDAEPRFR